MPAPAPMRASELVNNPTFKQLVKVLNISPNLLTHVVIELDFQHDLVKIYQDGYVVQRTAPGIVIPKVGGNGNLNLR